jgi:transglutaminase-like putative cysteine protease
MSNFTTSGDGFAADGALRVISCDLTFQVTEPAEVVLQLVASNSAGRVLDQRLDVSSDGRPPTAMEELWDAFGARMQVVDAPAGRLTVAYRAEISAWVASPAAPPTSNYDRQLYLRPSRYCPSDHLIGFAVAEFGTGPGVSARVAAITEWIWRRIGYVPGSSTVHDSAEHTLLTGMGTCRDFAHLGIALCRATGVPARFVAVYAPGLFPMDFHAVFEAFEDGRWCAHDATGLAPRASMVRVVTGRDAADTAFAAITSGLADLEAIEVTATVGSVLPEDDRSQVVQLA